MTGQMIINTSDFHFATEDLHATSEIIPTSLSVYPTKVATSSDNDIMPFLERKIIRCSPDYKRDTQVSTLNPT